MRRGPHRGNEIRLRSHLPLLQHRLPLPAHRSPLHGCARDQLLPFQALIYLCSVSRTGWALHGGQGLQCTECPAGFALVALTLGRSEMSGHLPKPHRSLAGPPQTPCSSQPTPVPFHLSARPWTQMCGTGLFSPPRNHGTPRVELNAEEGWASQAAPRPCTSDSVMSGDLIFLDNSQ